VVSIAPLHCGIVCLHPLCHYCNKTTMKTSKAKRSRHGSNANKNKRARACSPQDSSTTTPIKSRSTTTSTGRRRVKVYRNNSIFPEQNVSPLNLTPAQEERFNEAAAALPPANSKLERIVIKFRKKLLHRIIYFQDTVIL